MNHLLLDISNSDEKNLPGIFSAIESMKEDKYDKLCSIIKILIENIGKL